MKKVIMNTVVMVLMTLAFIAVDAAMIVWSVDQEEIIVTLWAIATVLGTGAFEVNWIKNNFVRD